MIERNEPFFLFQEIAHRLDEHLELMTLQPEVIVDFASVDTAMTHLLKQRYPKATLHTVPFTKKLPWATDSVDCIVSHLGTAFIFSECARVLKPHGLFLFSSWGPDTLKECSTQHFMDMHDVGDALLEAHLVDPVMEAEYITLDYQRADTLQKDLYYFSITEHQMPVPCTLTIEVIYGHAWKSAQAFLRDGVARIPVERIAKRR